MEDKFELADRSNAALFWLIMKKNKILTDNPPIWIYQQNENIIIIVKIKTRYCLKLLTPEMVKLLGSTKNKITKDTNCENEPHLQITKVVLVHCKIVNNDYQHDTRVLHTFFPDKLFKKILNTEILHNEV